MINNLKIAIIDIPNTIKKSDTLVFLRTQLEMYYPEPNLLYYDYYILKGIGKKQAIVAYLLKDKIKELSIKEHPYLLFKNILKKDGYYIIIHDQMIFEIIIRDNLMCTFSNKLIDEFNNIPIPKESIIIAEPKLKELIETRYKEELINLNKLYKKCKKNFLDNYGKKKKKVRFKELIFYAMFPIICFIFIGLINDKKILKGELKTKNGYLENRLVALREENNHNNEYYNSILMLEKQITPDIFIILNELKKLSKNYKIRNLNYSNNNLAIDAVTLDSIILFKNFKKSQLLNFQQNTTTNYDNYEHIKFNIEVERPR